MLIVHIYKDYFPVRGGIENHVRVLAEAQVSAGHRVTVLACAPGGTSFQENVNGVDVRRCGRFATVRSMPLSLELFQKARHARADVLHVHSPFPLGELALRNAPREMAVVATHHSDVVRQKLLLKLHAVFYRRFLQRANLLLPTSEAYAGTSPWLKPHASKCRVVPLGVDIARFSPGWKPTVENSELRLLFVGRLRYYKGLDTLLRALATLPQHLRLDVVGRGPMEQDWRRLAESLGLGERVVFRGELDDKDLSRAYREADLFVLPCNCRAEAFGTVLLEAMACGLACITSDVGSGTSWVVADGETGLVVPPGDSEALAVGIAGLDADRPRLRAFGMAGRHRTEEHFTEFAMVTAVERVYEEARHGATHP